MSMVRTYSVRRWGRDFALARFGELKPPEEFSPNAA